MKSEERGQRIYDLYQGLRRHVRAHLDAIPTSEAEGIAVEAIATLFAREMVDQCYAGSGKIPPVDFMMMVWRNADEPMRHSFEIVIEELTGETAARADAFERGTKTPQ